MNQENEMTISPENIQEISEEFTPIEAADSTKVSESAKKENPSSDVSMAEQLKERIFGDLNSQDLEAVLEVPLQISVVLGKTIMPVHKLLKLGRGAVIELDKKVGEATDIYVNNVLVARGELIIVEDRLGITMTEIIKTHVTKINPTKI